MNFKRLVKVSDSAMKSVDHLDINNYTEFENGYVQVGDQVVHYECFSEPSASQWNDVEDEYPYTHQVEVFLGYGTDDERRAEGVSRQWSSEDSAWYEGFRPAYAKACRELGVKPLYR